MLPGEHLHRWIADFELKGIDTNYAYSLKPGDMATIISDEGHGAYDTKRDESKDRKSF